MNTIQGAKIKIKIKIKKKGEEKKENPYSFLTSNKL